jgi:uncharacterized protein (DUF2147 family)
MNPAQRRLLVAIVLLGGVSLSFADELPLIDGIWLNDDGDGLIEVIATDTDLLGIIAGSPDPADDRPDKDEKNPDPALRDRPLIGLNLFAGFEYDGDGRWSGGTIYDPNSGKTYRCIVTLVDANTLKIRGYVGVPLLGRTDTWTRTQD